MLNPSRDIVIWSSKILCCY